MYCPSYYIAVKPGNQNQAWGENWMCLTPDASERYWASSGVTPSATRSQAVIWAEAGISGNLYAASELVGPCCPL